MAMKTTVSPLTDFHFNIHSPKIQPISLNSSYALPLPFSVRCNQNLPLHFRRRFLHSSAIQRRRSLPSTCFVSDGTAYNVEAKATTDDLSLEVKKKAKDVAPELKGTSIFLVGINSSLKTKLGKLLADMLRYYYFDSDSLVVEASGGVAAAKLYKESDENGFRASETEVLKQLSSMGRLVVCAGNGAVRSSTNLALLRHGITLWIDIPLQIIAEEFAEDRGQLPVFDISTSGSYSEVLGQITSLYQEIKVGYATADASISLQKLASTLGYDDFNAVTTEDMALEALKEIEKLIRMKKMMEAAAKPF
ncbi:probable inactive shikimate kinase like 1, chloroplastic isoform X2 [Cucurbita moschata]|uniref:Probable inactive shikimate kinase like 1, chloroplastic isoform X2 n=1 Tax=Cucurbita moschata TaxID=3662 RepID=A0A6J1EPF2_CUCMO|nr:probable inactive shikimate kinase like 1, chloroplastic isoform X2 [Cucurbita moschata]